MSENLVSVKNIEKGVRYRTYVPGFDRLRLISMVFIVALVFGLPIPYFELAQPFFSFASGTLFAIYGFLVLRDGEDLTRNIKHTAKVFGIMFVVYSIITLGYFYIFFGDISSFFSKRNIFNFLVLNVWPVDLCSSIWYIQSTLYALIICKLLSRFKKYDWLLCIILFVFATIVGEFSTLINFNVFGYTYIPGNFLTRALPYMLLGRLIHKHLPLLNERVRVHPMIIFFVGFVISIIELYVLYSANQLYYAAHFIGYIIMAASIVYFIVSKVENRREKRIDRYYSSMFKALFYIYNPLGYITLTLLAIFVSAEAYSTIETILGVIVLVVTLGFSLLIAFIKDQMKKYDRQTNTADIINEEDEDE